MVTWMPITTNSCNQWLEWLAKWEAMHLIVNLSAVAVERSILYNDRNHQIRTKKAATTKSNTNNSTTSIMRITYTTISPPLTYPTSTKTMPMHQERSEKVWCPGTATWPSCKFQKRNSRILSLWWATSNRRTWNQWRRRRCMISIDQMNSMMVSWMTILTFCNLLAIHNCNSQAITKTSPALMLMRLRSCHHLTQCLVKMQINNMI